MRSRTGRPATASHRRSTTTPGNPGEQHGEAAPADGGTLRFGAYAEPRVLDPAQTMVAGARAPTSGATTSAASRKQGNEDVPALVFGAVPEFLARRGEVHGVNGSVNSIVLLFKAVEREEG